VEKMQGKEFRKLRKGAGLTQRRLAITLNITETTISNWESGRIQVPRMAEIAINAIIKGEVKI
jgi:DNA-binding transcriptional regulator YiaG